MVQVDWRSLRLLNIDAHQRRYEIVRNEIGLGHEGEEWNVCLPSCRYYKPEGRLEDIEVLSFYKNYQYYDEVLDTWLKLDEQEQKKK
jgi:hypothetical protein